MTDEETTQVIATINAYRHKPLDDSQARFWSTELVELPFEATMTAIRKIGRGEGFLSLGAIFAEVSPAPAPPSPSEVYRKLRSAVNIHAPDRRAEAVGPALNAIARDLGGWESVARWRIDGEPYDVRRVEKSLARIQDLPELDLAHHDAFALEATSRKALPAGRSHLKAVES